MAIVKIMTPTFRVAFPNIWEVGKLSGKYGLTMLFNMDDLRADPEQAKKFVAMKELVKAACLEKWHSKDNIPDTYATPFKEGSEKADYDGYGDGVIFVNATSKYQPGVVDQKKVEIINPSQLYGGCYARATVNAYAWEYMGKSGAGFGIQNIQLVREGEPFGGRSNPEKDFDALEVDTAGNEAVESDLFGEL